MKTMSKILATILIVVLCVSLFTVQAFAAGHSSDCEAVAGQTYIHYDAVAASCEEAGNIEYQECSVCHQKMKMDGSWLNDGEEIIPATGHTPDSAGVQTTSANCFMGGETYFICDNCGNKIVTATTPKLGHSLGTHHPAAAGADCKTKGNIEYYECANGCGALLNKAGEVITSEMIWNGARGEHDWSGSWVVETPATETHGGTEVKYCKNGCGEKQTRTIEATGVSANPAGNEIYPIIATRDTWFRGEELPQFWSDLIGQLNARGGTKVNYVGVRIGTSKSLYANGYDTLDFWSSGNTITLGEAMLRNLDAGDYWLWVYDVDNPNRHTDSIAFHIVDVPTLEPINTDRHVMNSTKNLRFRASEPITASSVKVGGKSLYDANYYYVSNDGLTITLSPDFLNERQAGTYTISANTVANGTKVSCPFYILSTASGSSASPKTADESQLGLWAAFLLLSGAAVVVLVPKIRKHGA